MIVTPTTIKDASEFVGLLHRHHGEPRGGKFAIAATVDSITIGVAIVGRPVARCLDDKKTAEVTRLCTDGTRNACSFLYGACARIAREMGYARIITYTLASEPGESLRGAGWRPDAKVRGRSWSCESRPRTDKHPTVDKIRWSRLLRELHPLSPYASLIARLIN